MWTDNQMFCPVGVVGFSPSGGRGAAEEDPEHQGCPDGGGHPAGETGGAGSCESF